MQLTQEERVHLIGLVDDNLHHEILDTVLSDLPKEQKKTFLHHVAAKDHEKVWDVIKTHIQDAEEKIRKVAKAVIKEFEEDIEEAKKATKD